MSTLRGVAILYVILVMLMSTDLNLLLLWAPYEKAVNWLLSSHPFVFFSMFISAIFIAMVLVGRMEIEQRKENLP